jgi:hypothetical protein
MSLAAHGLPSETPSRIRHDAKQQTAFLQFGPAFRPAHIHGNRVDRIGTLAIRIEQAAADGIQRAPFRPGTESALTVTET